MSLLDMASLGASTSNDLPDVLLLELPVSSREIVANTVRWLATLDGKTFDLPTLSSESDKSGLLQTSGLGNSSIDIALSECLESDGSSTSSSISDTDDGNETDATERSDDEEDDNEDDEDDEDDDEYDEGADDTDYEDFYLFSFLPLAVRSRIWTYALPGPREAVLKPGFPAPTPAMASANQESRAVVLRHYSVICEGGHKNRRIYLNTKLDTLVIVLNGRYDWLPAVVASNAEVFDKVKHVQLLSKVERDMTIALNHFLVGDNPLQHFKRLKTLSLEVAECGNAGRVGGASHLTFPVWVKHTMDGIYSRLESEIQVEGLVKPKTVDFLWGPY